MDPLYKTTGYQPISTQEPSKPIYLTEPVAPEFLGTEINDASKSNFDGSDTSSTGSYSELEGICFTPIHYTRYEIIESLDPRLRNEEEQEKEVRIGLFTVFLKNLHSALNLITGLHPKK